jgi:hypothetical protein
MSLTNLLSTILSKSKLKFYENDKSTDNHIISIKDFIDNSISKKNKIKSDIDTKFTLIKKTIDDNMSKIDSEIASLSVPSS